MLDNIKHIISESIEVKQQVLQDEELLQRIAQVADVLDAGHAAVEQVVRETDQLPVTLRHEREHRLVGLQESSPGGLRDVFRQCRVSKAAIERVVAVPERAPGALVARLERADDAGIGHGVGRGGTFSLAGQSSARQP